MTSASSSELKNDKSIQRSLKQPAWHIVLLSVFTFTLYLIAWFYKTVRVLHDYALKTRYAPDAQPWLAKYARFKPIFTLPLMIVPFVNLILFGVLFRDIAKLAPDASPAQKYPTFTALMLCLAMSMLWGLCKCGGAFYLLFTLAAVPVAIAQHFLNDYWARTEPADTVLRKGFSAFELGCLVFGSMLLALVLLTPSFDIKP